MSTANSPTYAAGIEDGWRDEQRIKSCPAMPPVGPQPPFPAYPVMYLRGYQETYSGAPHVCTDRCRRSREQLEMDTRGVA